MKIDWNRKYTTIAVYGFIVIASSILFCLIMAGLDTFIQILKGYLSVFYPFFVGLIIAFLVNFFLNFFKKHLIKLAVIKKMKKTKFHILCLCLSYLTFGFLIYLFLAFILPQVIDSVVGLVKNMQDYVKSATEYIQNLSLNTILPLEVIDFINKRWDELAVFINDTSKDLLPMGLSLLRNTALSIWNVVLSIILSIYMLAEKDRFICLVKKVNYGVFNIKTADKLIELSRRAQKIFGSFIGGKILDSFIIGFLAFIILSIVNMPYTLLISFIITVTNIIPFFGPFIGAIPSVIIIFFESPIMAFWFLVIILVLQQIDGNVIGPKILGESLGISSFWILFAILVGGKLFGVVGLIIGVPLFVFIYSIMKDIIEERLKEKGLPVNTDEYTEK